MRTNSDLPSKNFLKLLAVSAVLAWGCIALVADYRAVVHWLNSAPSASQGQARPTKAEAKANKAAAKAAKNGAQTTKKANARRNDAPQTRDTRPADVRPAAETLPVPQPALSEEVN